MTSRLEKIGIELIGLSDLKAEGKKIPEVSENGNTPLENARIKAHAYYNAFRMPVFSCDSGLYFGNVPDEIQPGVHLTDKPHSEIRKKGFPLNSMSIDIKTNKYYYDLPTENKERSAVEAGFLSFFKKVLNLN